MRAGLTSESTLFKILYNFAVRWQKVVACEDSVVAACIRIFHTESSRILASEGHAARELSYLSGPQNTMQHFGRSIKLEKTENFIKVTRVGNFVMGVMGEGRFLLNSQLHFCRCLFYIPKWFETKKITGISFE